MKPQLINNQHLQRKSETATKTTNNNLVPKRWPQVAQAHQRH